MWLVGSFGWWFNSCICLSRFLTLCFRISRGEVRYATFVPLFLYIPSPNNDDRGHKKERKPVMNDVSGLRIEHTQAAKSLVRRHTLGK